MGTPPDAFRDASKSVSKRLVLVRRPKHDSFNQHELYKTSSLSTVQPSSSLDRKSREKLLHLEVFLSSPQDAIPRHQPGALELKTQKQIPLKTLKRRNRHH